MKDETEEEDNLDDSIVQIDEHNLDRECIRLPNQYRQAAYSAAEANRDIDEAKAEFEVRESELRLRIRNTPGQYNLEKVTEGAINDTVKLDPKLQALEKKIRHLKHKLEISKALVYAMDMKKRSLTNLVELHSAGYHAEVRPSSEGRKSLDKLSRDRISRPITRERKEDRE